MNDYEAINPPRTLKRAISIVIDLIVCFTFFMFFQYICTPIINNTFHYDDLVVAYQDSLVKYNLARYDMNDAGETVYIEYTVGDGENALSEEEYNSARTLFEKDASAVANAQKMNAVSLISMSLLLLFLSFLFLDKFRIVTKFIVVNVANDFYFIFIMNHIPTKRGTMSHNILCQFNCIGV